MRARDDFRGRTLLALCHNYASFTKDQIETIARSFEHVYVMARFKPLAEWASTLPLPALKPFRRQFALDQTHLPPNVTLIPIPLLYLPGNRAYKRVGPAHARAVEKVIRTRGIRFDLIHAHFVWSAGYAGAQLKERFGVPFVLTAHGYDVYDLPFRDDDWRRKCRAVINASDRTITVSRSNAETLKRLDLTAKIEVIPNGFNGELFAPTDSHAARRRLGLPMDKRIVLAVGNLVEIKGHRILIDAMAELARSRNDVYCVVIGSGPTHGALTRQIRQCGLDGVVQMPGAVPHDSLSDWINACDVMAHPSLRESFGVVQLEAMACGKPVVATRNGGSEEIVVSDAYGTLVDAGDSSALAQGIACALDREYDAGAIRGYAEPSTWEHVCDRVLDVYESVLP